MRTGCDTMEKMQHRLANMGGRYRMIGGEDKVDLHLHTQASDGTWTAETLVEEAVQAGLKLIAITDHDSMGSLARGKAAAGKAGLAFLPGVEVTSTYKGQCFHMLGYGIDPGNRELQDLIDGNRKRMDDADHESIKILIQDGLPVVYEDYERYVHDPSRGGWKSLHFLVDQGLCTDVRDFFSRIFIAEKGIRFPEFSSPDQVIQIIHRAGGAAVVAHPGSEFHGTQLTETLEAFAEMELDGVECFHPSHDEATCQFALKWCRERKLLVTGGSDCHGSFVAKRFLGRPDIRLGQLALGRLMKSIEK